MSQTAIIVGAGTAGLTAHLALRDAGFEITHLERKATMNERGGNLIIWPNGGRVLEHFGLRVALDQMGFPPKRFEVFDDQGVPVSTIDLGLIADRMGGLPMYMVPRAHFQNMFLNAPGVSGIRFGASVTGYTQDSDGVTVTTDDGETLTADVLIAADGVRSPIRRRMLGDVELPWVGITIWTGWMEDDGFLDEVSPHPDCMVEFWGSGKRVVVMPSGRGHAGFTFIMRVPEDFAPEDPHAWLTETFGGFHPTVGRILQRLGGEQIIRWPVYQVPSLERWSDGRVVLVGDAAHAASPTMGQGAGMALEDGYELAECLKDESVPLSSRLARFEELRRERTEMIVRESAARSVASTEPDPVKVKAIQDASRHGDVWTILNGMADVVAGGPLTASEAAR